MGSKKVAYFTDENYWRTCIEEARLNDTTWKVKVIIIEPAVGDQDRFYLNKFEAAAVEEKRFVIKNICKTEIIFMINQLGGEKKVKDDKLRVFEEGQVFLKDKRDIPAEILALIIKHLILKMKDEYLFIESQRLTVREGIKNESLTMIDRAEVRGSVRAKQAEPPQAAHPTKGKDLPVSDRYSVNESDDDKKYNTSLRLRGEEWRDKIYIDDFPIDGPNLYVAITGFLEPDLPSCLIKIGIPLTAIIQVRIDPTTVDIRSSLFRTTKRGQSKTEILGEKCLTFWEDLQLLRIKNDCDYLKNTAFVIFSPPISDKNKLSGDQDRIYDELSYLMYDIQDLSRQHTHYLDNMGVINIPLEKPDSVLLQSYHRELSILPVESTTLYSIMDSILQIVVKNVLLKDKDSQSSLLTISTSNESYQDDEEKDKINKVETYVKDLFNSLCTDNNKRKYRITQGEEYENHKGPIVIKFGDIAKYNTFHIEHLSLNNIVSSMLHNMPVNKLWNSFNSLASENKAKINFHVNLLLSCFNRSDCIDNLELNRLLHILACRKLYNNRSSLKKNHLPESTVIDLKKRFLKRSILAEPLKKCPSFNTRPNSKSSLHLNESSKEQGNPSDVSLFNNDEEKNSKKLIFECPDISELVSTTEIASQCPINHMIDDLEFFEDFSDVIGFQVIHDAYNLFNCIDYKYCEVTDSLILMFFNSCDKDGITRDEWRSHIETPLCLQDFFDYVLEESYDWIKNAEKLYDETMLFTTYSEPKELGNASIISCCFENTHVEKELLMEGSLKYQNLCEGDPNEELSDSKSITPKNTSFVSTSNNNTKRNKKANALGISTPKKLERSLVVVDSSSVSRCESPRIAFYGYNLCDRRVEAFGRYSSYFSSDGTQIISNYTLLIPYNKEYAVLNIVSGNGANKFWLHKVLGENIKKNLMDTCESLRINSKDDVSIWVAKKRYTVPITEGNDNISKENHNKLHFPNTSDEQILESSSLHTLFITWPNGLITETVYNKNSPILSHIKQHYISSICGIDEDMRCISLNGEVIKFNKSGDIEILQPGGYYTNILKCYKSKTERGLQEEIQSDASSGTGKKINKKVHVKEKYGKINTKVSKAEFDNYDKRSKPEDIEYELFIEEFVTIDTSGFLRKWINNMCVDTEKLLIKTATDYCLGEIYSRRSDGTSILLNKEGKQVVTFPDNTRIITDFVVESDEVYPEWAEEDITNFHLDNFNDIDYVQSKESKSQRSSINSKVSIISDNSNSFCDVSYKKTRNDGYISVQIIYIIEHSNFTTVTINKANGKVSIDSPNNTSITIDGQHAYEFILDDVTVADFDGTNLNIKYEACSECQTRNKCTVKVTSDKINSNTELNKVWLEMKDSNRNRIIVNEEGEIICLDYLSSNETLSVIDKSHGSLNSKNENTNNTANANSHTDCEKVFQAQSRKFFVLRRDLSCSELVHRTLVEQYKHKCRWQQWCSINQYDTFGDHRSMCSILSPIHLTESEKWLMNSKLAGKPKHLLYKDLKEDTGKGFYDWMRPYERFQPEPVKPDNAVPFKLPKAYVLRTLEQQWNDAKREELKGAKELISAILKYRHIIEYSSETILHVPIKDFRTEYERQKDDVLQNIAHRVYEDLQRRLAEDIQGRARSTITTKSQVDTLDEEEKCKATLNGEMKDAKEVESTVEMSTQLKRYWQRRAEELKDEQFYRCLLREGTVPPYFRNVLGGAIWWDMNNAAGDAAAYAEKKKTKCMCHDKETRSK